MDPADYVLGRFPKGEEAALEECLGTAAEAARLAVELGAQKAMNQVNRRPRPDDATQQ
jgi:PTH1 family peptidyl-tRNA hydrolase